MGKALNCENYLTKNSSSDLVFSAGGTQRLPRLVGKSAAKELIFTGRKIDGRSAMSMGIVSCSFLALACWELDAIILDFLIFVNKIKGFNLIQV